MLDARRLHLLHQLATHGTVAAAAAAMHLSGPAVSQQLAALEREAKVPLLEKHGRRLRLTPAGQLLAAHAEVIAGDLAAAEAELVALRGGERGTVRIAAFPSAARVLIPPVWRQLAAGGPALQLLEQEPDGAIRVLRERAADVAVVHSYTLLPRDLPAGCEQHPLVEDPVLLAVPVPGEDAEADGNDLAADEPVELARFASSRWLTPGPETSCHEMIQRACGTAGFVPAAVARASDFSVITALVAAGAGVALVPRMALPDVTPGIRLHPLTEPITRSICALTRPGTARRPDIRRVVAALTGAASEWGNDPAMRRDVRPSSPPRPNPN